MRKRERDNLQARIEQHLEFWRNVLPLSDWQIKTTFPDSYEIAGEEPGSMLNFAITFPAWEYLSATITFHMENLSKVDDHELEETVLHELFHLVLAELEVDQDRQQHEERVVTLLARSLLHANIAGYTLRSASPSHPERAPSR